MDQLIELLQQIQDLAGVGIEALQAAAGGGGAEAGGPPPEAPAEGGGAPKPPPEHPRLSSDEEPRWSGTFLLSP